MANESEKNRIPTHIGIIMDGNGRWARQRGMLRTQGHLEGLKSAKETVKAASELGVSYLTLYTFSTENWKRSADEVGFIMTLVKQYLRGELDFYRENRVRIRHTGDRNGLPPDILAELDMACKETQEFSGLQVILALNYGGRNEILRAVSRMAKKGILAADASANVNANASANANANANADIVSGLTEKNISDNMDNPDVPDPDLIIRTAGEFRTSNFLLWEGAYAEYFISDKLWPDWKSQDLLNAIEEYQKRDRRFGGKTGKAQ